MAIKRIDFDLSLKFYLKDFKEYERKECHVNTFQRFFDCNIDEVEKNSKLYKYSIGLLMGEMGSRRICYIHSWVERNGQVLDVTPFANIFLTDQVPLSGPDYDMFKELTKSCKYYSFKTISNTSLNKELRKKTFSSKSFEPGKAMENLILDWIEEIKNDPVFQRQIKECGYEFIDD